MKRQEILRLRHMLFERRKEIIDRVMRLKAGLQDLEERAIELEEEAQKASITEAYDQLDESGKNEIGQIDLALNKIVLGDYGICEACGDDIALRRLEALPSARLCVDCAREYERKRESLPPTYEVFGSARLPEEYRELTNEQVLKLIYDRLHSDSRIDIEELRVTLRKGSLYLEGTIPGESGHEMLLETLTETLGFSAVVDRLEVTAPDPERNEQAANEDDGEEDSDDLSFYEQEELTEILYETGEEIPYSLPKPPAPHEEHRYR